MVERTRTKHPARGRRLGLAVYFICAFLGLAIAVPVLLFHVRVEVERGGKTINYAPPFTQDLYKRLQFLQFACEEHMQNVGSLPVTDDRGTWYRKLVDTTFEYGEDWWGSSEDPFLPLDPYGHPIVMDSQTLVRGGMNNTLLPVFRMVGENGIDDGGKGDDFDIRFGANWGYWDTANWPEARVAAYVSAGLALIVFLLTRALRLLRRIEAVAFYCAAAMIVLPAYAILGGHYLTFRYAPDWFGIVHGWGIVLALFTLGHSLLRLKWASDRKVRLKYQHCWRCNYDLHGTCADRCPECGAATTPPKRLTFNLWAFGRWHDAV